MGEGGKEIEQAFLPQEFSRRRADLLLHLTSINLSTSGVKRPREYGKKSQEQDVNDNFLGKKVTGKSQI